MNDHGLMCLHQSVSYGSGYFEGEEYTDTVTLGDGLTITKQSIGVASYAEGFSGVDGILGLVTLNNSPCSQQPDLVLQRRPC